MLCKIHAGLLHFTLFADSTTISIWRKDISSKVDLIKIDLINTELKEVTNWFKTSKLSVNASKTNFLILGTTHQTSKPTIFDKISCKKI